MGAPARPGSARTRFGPGGWPLKNSLAPSLSPPSAQPLPRTVLAELQRLPAARCLPPFLRFKPQEPEAAPPQRDAPAAPAAPAPAAPAQRPAWTSKPVVLDPTALLLMEAAAQLQELVTQQEQLRRLRRQHCCPEDSDSECGSDSEACDEPGSYPGGSCDTFSAPRSLDTVGSVSVATVSASASGSCPTSLSSVGGASLPLSASLRAARAGIGGGEKRCRLERQYAIDLDGYCRIIGQRLPLPMPQEAQD